MLMKRKIQLAVALVLTLAFGVSGAVAATTTKTISATDGQSGIRITEIKDAAPRQPVSSVQSVSISTGDFDLAVSIGNTFNMAVYSSDIAVLRSKNFGYGEISLAYSLAHASGRPVGEIIAMRENKMGWGNIAKALGVKLHDAGDQASAIVIQAKLDNEAVYISETIRSEEQQQANNPKADKVKGYKVTKPFNSAADKDDTDAHGERNRDDKHDNGNGHGRGHK